MPADQADSAAAPEFNEVFFTDVRIPDSQRLGADGEGWKVALTTLMNERLAVGTATGILGRRRPDEPRPRSATSTARPPSATAPCARRSPTGSSRARASSTRKFRTWTALSRGRDAGAANRSITKVVSARQMQDLAAFAMELMGEGGIMTDDVPGGGAFQAQWLGAAGFRIAGGTDEILRNIIAERVLGLPQDTRADKDGSFRDLEARQSKARTKG